MKTQLHIFEVELITTIQVRDAALNRWPDGCERATLYAFRDGETIFYVGRSASICTRLHEHVTGKTIEWGGQTNLTELIHDNLPESKAWTIEMYAPVNPVSNVDLVESDMIYTLRPVLNSARNRRGSKLPGKYKTRHSAARIANDGIAWPSA